MRQWRVALIPDEVRNEGIKSMNLTEKADRLLIERLEALMKNENIEPLQSREGVRKVPTRAQEKKENEDSMIGVNCWKRGSEQETFLANSGVAVGPKDGGQNDRWLH